MKRSQPLTTFQEIVAALFVLLFLYTAITKLSDTAMFARSLAKSPLIGGISGFLSGFIPAIEIGVTVALILPFTRWWGLLLSTLLMAGFTSYIAYLVLTSSTLPCTCGGVIEKLNWSQHLFLNIGLLVVGLASITSYKRSIAKDRRSRTPAT